MKSKSTTHLKSKSTWFLPTLTVVCLSALPALQAEVWNVVGSTPTTPNTVNFSNYNWNDAANWNLASIPNGIDASAEFTINILFTGVTPQLQGTQAINLNVPTIVGNLTLGDSFTSGSPAFNGNGFYNIVNGTAGSLTFEKSSDSATLQKTVGSGTLDTILATVTLNSPLTADVRTGTIEIGNGAANALGRIGGTVGITRAAGVTAPAVPVTTGGNLILSNPGNTYTGETVIEHGTLSARLSGDILDSTNSNFGNASSPIKLGTFNTSTDIVVIGSTPTAVGTSTLNFIATNDATNYTVSRGLNLSDSLATQTARQTIFFNGNLYNFNGAGGLNTNKLTLSGPIDFGPRGIQISVLRSGMTLDITGNITSPTSGLSDLRFGGFPSPANVDGQGSGTIRFSNINRSFGHVTGLVSGTLIIDGVVGALSTDSPIGRQVCNLNLGTGGNILGGANFTANAAVGLDTSADITRSIFLDSAGSSYARNIGIGAASTTIATGVLTPTTGSTAIPAGYGLNNGATATDQSQVNVPNGFRIGGLNTTGTTTYSGNIVSGTMRIGHTGTNNTINVGINLALMSGSPTVAGGTVAFTGVISDTTDGVLPVRPSVTRVTVNQFRNHPNLDGNNGTIIGADGNADTNANALIGSPTGGTVIVSGANTWQGGTEVLGGTLLANNLTGSGTGTGAVAVVSGAKFGGNGTVTGPVNVASGGGLAFVVNSAVAGHDKFDITGVLALPASSSVTILNGAGAEVGLYTLATAAGGITGTLPTLITPEGVTGNLIISGNDLQLNVTAVGGNDYDTWINTFPTITGGGKLPTADPDNDGLKNQQEYAFGLIPNSGSSVNPITSQLNKTTGLFSYTRRKPSLTGLVYTYEYSTTLAGWTNFTPDSTSSNSGDPVEIITVDVPDALLANPAIFVRVVAK